jgi:ubiquinone/menaquinone biosynthesis C-methylase UbiE
MSRLLDQWRKPTGWLGRILPWVLNISHSKVNNWGLKHVSIEKDYTILDVGCGGGMTVKKLAGMTTEGKVYGIDFSQESVAVSRRTNTRLIRMGRVEIRHGSVSSLPFADDMFDLATAVDSHYYWPHLVPDMQEVLRVLKPGGKLVIIGETYKGSKYEKRDHMFVKSLRLANHSIDELADIISSAGYSDVRMFEERENGWMCGVAKKPLDEQE